MSWVFESTAHQPKMNPQGSTTIRKSSSQEKR